MSRTTWSSKSDLEFPPVLSPQFRKTTQEVASELSGILDEEAAAAQATQLAPTKSKGMSPVMIVVLILLLVALIVGGSVAVWYFTKKKDTQY